MKRFISCFFIVTILFSCFTTFAKPLEYEISATTKEELSENINTYCFDLLNNLSEDFTIILSGEYIESLSFKDISENTYFFESPLILNYINNGIDDYNSLILRKYTISKTVYKNNFSIDKVIKVKINYKIQWDEQQYQKSTVYNYARTISNNILLDVKNNNEKALLIHNYIIDNFQYDTINQKSSLIHSPSQMITNGYGVCSAYAGLMAAFLDVNNIENRVILKDAYANENISEKVPHAWNLVNLNNAWYHIDSTWDDPVTNLNTNIKSYKYFLVSDETMQKDHIWDKAIYPPALASYEENKKKQVISPVSDSIYKSYENEFNNTSFINFRNNLFYQNLFDIILNANFIIGFIGVLSLIILFILTALSLKR